MNQPRCAVCGRFVDPVTGYMEIIDPAEDLREWVCLECARKEKARDETKS